MKVNHEQTKKLIIDITDIIRAQAQVAKSFRIDRNKWDNEKTYSQEYRNDLISKLREDYNTKYNETKEAIAAKLEEILKIELENEKILELDVPEFANTLAAINSVRGKLPETVINTIKINFAGQYQALLAIAAAFENYDVDLSEYGYAEYLKSVSFAIEPLFLQAKDIEQSEVSTFVSLHKLLKDVIKFGEVRGVTFSEDTKKFGDGLDEEAKEIIARKAMGLETVI